MSVTAEDFKNFADALVNSEHEIDLRNYISRSYYHAFHVIRPFSETLPVPPTLPVKIGSHEFVIKVLSGQPSTNPKVLKLRSLSYLLAKVRANRNIADYDINDSINVQQHQDDLENVFKKLQECI